MTTTKQNCFRRSLSLLLALVMCLGMVSVNAFAAETEDTSPAVTINDENLRKAICASLGKEYSEGVVITENDMAGLTELVAENAGITVLTGLDKAVNLEVLDLSGNDLNGKVGSGLDIFNYFGFNASFAKSIKSLDLNNCNIGGEIGASMDYSWLNKYENLEYLNLSNNNLYGLVRLGYNSIDSINPFKLGNLKQADFSNNNFTGFVCQSNAKFSNLEKIDLSNNRMWVNENSKVDGTEWYQYVVKIGYDKFDFSNQKSLTELASVWKSGDADAYSSVSGMIDNENHTIDLGTVVTDTVSYRISYFGNFEELSVIANGWDLPKMVDNNYKKPSLNSSRTTITWNNLKIGQNTIKLIFSHAGGDTSEYTLKVTRTELPSVGEGENAAGITDPNLHAAICSALGLNADKLISKDDLAGLTSLTAENITSAEGLQYAVNLRTLNLTGELTTLPDFSALQSLTSLVLHGNYKSVSGLTELSNLTTLELSGIDMSGKFETLDLTGMTKLTTLTLKSTEMETAVTLPNTTVKNLSISQAKDGTFPSLAQLSKSRTTVALYDVHKSTMPKGTNNSKITYLSIHSDDFPENLFENLELDSYFSLEIYAENGTQNDTIDISGENLNYCELSIYNWNQEGTVLTLKGQNKSIGSLALYSDVTTSYGTKVKFDESLRLNGIYSLTLGVELSDSMPSETVDSLDSLAALVVTSFYSVNGNHTIPSALVCKPTISTLMLQGNSAPMTFDEEPDFGAMTNLTTLYLYTLGDFIPDKLPSSLTTLFIQDGTFGTLENKDYSNVTGLNTLTLMNCSVTEFPTTLVKNNKQLKTLSISNGLFSSVPADVFDDSTSLTTVSIGNWLALELDDSDKWIPIAGSTTESAINKLKENCPKVKITLSAGTEKSMNYASLTSISSVQGVVSGNPATDLNLSIYVPVGSTEVSFVPIALLDDTAITINGVEYKSGDTVILPLNSFSETFEITTHNDFKNALNLDTDCTYKLVVSQGTVMDKFIPVDGGVYNISSMILKNGVTAVSMADNYFQRSVTIRYNENAEEGKKYDIRVTTNKASWITDFKYKDNSGEYVQADIVDNDIASDTRVYRIYADNLETAVKISPCVVPMGGDYPICDLALDLTNVIDISASVGVDKADLNAAINKAVEITEKNNVYTADSYSAMLAALEEAQKIAELSAPTQNAVDTAAKNLNDSIDGLVVDESKLADKLVLETALNDAKAIMKGNHTDTAWNALQEAIADAQAVYDTLEARQSEVDSAVKALNTAVTLFNSSGEASTLDKNNLKDGIYSVNADMIKTNRSEKSMADNAINHTVKLEVVNGEYFVTLDFRGITIENRFGYLKNLSYYADGYTYGPYGTVDGTLVPAEVLSTQKDSDGKDVIDQYNDAQTLYPDIVKIKLVPQAIADEDGYVPLHVFVPIMEAIAEGNGDQDVLMKIDWSTLKETTEDDPGFQPEEPVEQSPAVDVTDAATGVKVHADKGVFKEGVKVVVNEITKGADYDNAVSSLSDIGKKFKLYDVKFLDKDGNEVAPNGTVAISFPVGAGYNADKLAVYRINEDGSKTLVKGVVENGMYKVITKTAAKYALVEKDSTISDAQNTQNVNNGSANSPQTGDNSNLALWFMLMFASAGMLAVMACTRKRRSVEGE